MEGYKRLKTHMTCMRTPCTIWFLSVLLFSLCLLTSCVQGSGAQTDTSISRTAFYFNTIIEVRIYDEGADGALLDGCMELCHRYEQLLSARIGESDIARINAAQGEEVVVDAETAHLLTEAARYTEVTDGAFDITTGGVSSLWNFTGDPPGPVPAADEVTEALAHVGADRIVIHPADAVPLADGAVHAAATARVRLSDPDARIDLGAVAKGYVADRLKDYLAENGVTCALINLGGNVLALGGKPDGTPFSVGVRDPEEGSTSFLRVLEIADKSVVTSGNYERYFTEDGVRYHHILDARTGYPADNGIASVTVITDESLTGDILSTVLFLMGPEKGLSYAESLPFTEALFVTTSGEELMTSGFDAYVADVR